MLAWLDEIPLPMLLLATVMLGMAPFYPEPHLVEKVRMLSSGTLTRPLDIFDLLMHAAPGLLLVIKLVRMRITG